MKQNECDAKNVCDCVVSGEACDRDSAMTQHRIAESVRQRESEFIWKLAAVFVLLGGVCLVAAWGSEYYWESVFHLMYETGGFADNATEVARVQGYQALKPLVNITMYAIPKTLEFIGIGFLLMGGLMMSLESSSNEWRRYQQRRARKHAGQ